MEQEKWTRSKVQLRPITRRLHEYIYIRTYVYVSHMLTRTWVKGVTRKEGQSPLRSITPAILTRLFQVVVSDRLAWSSENGTWYCRFLLLLRRLRGWLCNTLALQHLQVIHVLPFIDSKSRSSGHERRHGVCLYGPGGDSTNHYARVPKGKMVYSASGTSHIWVVVFESLRRVALSI